MEYKRAFDAHGEEYVGGVEIKSETSGRITAVFATLHVVDHDGDVTLPGAFTSGAPVMISDWNHTSWHGAKPVGKGFIYEDGDEVILEGQFFMNTTHGRDAFETVKELGELASFSYGFLVDDSAPAPRDSTYGREHRRTLRKMTVHEVSPVLVAAGINTRLLAVKSDHRGRRATYLDARTQSELLALKARFERDERQELLALKQKLDDDMERAALIEELKGYAVAEGFLTGYREVSGPDVPAKAREAATATLARLDAPDVTVRWFVEENDPARAEFTDTKIAGFCRPQAVPGQIWVRADLGTDKVVEVCGHEIAHLDGHDEDHATAAGLKALFERGL
ncbi:HK97 family phage prohead protease [Streptomyces sp. SP17KL33]|uniref:HK97 family phage prohead protease n=1 Tax=Streptomyces sp. SP17KL33 TaxID=3002534 RepID=UPI002E77C3FD|nr:HK97 family phage prohead protease [Streptomyces sp. SP17KL33]MEE1834913.1 HK97 family phage prohead protease [Streptomyces sp. SP17KL33]